MSVTPLKWHGGKHYLADRIIQLMPPHTHYVEPYFGGGQVLFRKSPEGVSEVVNDLNEGLIRFWSVLRSRPQDLIQKLQMTPFSEAFWESAANPSSHRSDALMDAVNFFVRYRQSRQGLGKDFATLSRNRTRRGMNEQVSSWLSAIEGLPEAHQRLQRVVILNRPALEVIRTQDGPNTLFYLDPPYLHETRVTTSDYEFEMTKADHEELLEVLSGICGRFILSGYDNAVYAYVKRREGWHREDIQIDNKASGKKSKDVKIESLWMNFEPK